MLEDYSHVDIGLPIMRPSLETSAVVLRTRPYGESDKIVSFLTEDFGKVTGIAKGAMKSRRRFVNSLEPFSLVKLRFQDRPHTNLAFVVASELQSGFKRVITSLELISHASYLVEISEGLIGEREENRVVYEHLRDGLGYLEKNGTSLRFLTMFELKLLKLTGYQPTLGNCKHCGKERIGAAIIRWYFSLTDGGTLCDPCSRSRREVLPLGATAIEVLAILQDESQSLPNQVLLPHSVIKEIRYVVFRFIQYHMDREIKSAAFLHHFSSVEPVTGEQLLY